LAEANWYSTDTLPAPFSTNPLLADGFWSHSCTASVTLKVYHAPASLTVRESNGVPVRSSGMPLAPGAAQAN